MSDRWDELDEAEESRGRGWFWPVLLALAGLCAFALYRSALFRMSSLEVTGLDRLTEARLMEAAGLEQGTSRWLNPASAVEGRLKQEPWIKTATAAWAWNRVKIDLTERQAVGLLRYTGRYYLMLDESGMILGQTELVPNLGLPVISHKEVSSALRGQTLTEPGLQDALLLLSHMGDGLRAQVSEVKVADDRALTLFMASGATVDWGQVPPGTERDQAVDDKLETFGSIWKSVKKRSSPCRIDMRIDSDWGSESGCN